MDRRELLRLFAAALGTGVGGVAAATPRAGWTCTMHPEVRRNEPGKCPICRMALVRKQPKALG